ncbi:MAG: hypothetical protein U0599_14740 [Vicinamibacteria bacterium]
MRGTIGALVRRAWLGVADRVLEGADRQALPRTPLRRSIFSSRRAAKAIPSTTSRT